MSREPRYRIRPDQDYKTSYMRTPVVSIILPTYNRIALIGEAVESILAQTFEDWELLVVDDGSEDDTVKMLGDLGDERIVVIEAGRNGVIGKLKNIGLSAARGEYIAWMDSDDCWDPSKLEKQLEAMKRHPGAGFSLTGGYTFSAEGEPVQYYYKQRGGEFFGNILLAFIRSEVAALMPSLLMRKQCLEGTGIFNEQRLFSDIEFMLRLAAAYDAVLMYEPLLQRRIHPDNTTNDNWKLGYDEYAALLSDYHRRGLVPARDARDALFRLFINYGEKYLYFQEPIPAAGRFLKAWQQRPLSVVPFKKLGKCLVRKLVPH